MSTLSTAPQRTLRLSPLLRLPLLLLALLSMAFPALALSSTPPPSPDLYVSSAAAQNIQSFDKTTGFSAGSVSVGTPAGGVAFGPDGALYIAGNGNNDVLRYDPQAGTTSVFVVPNAGGLSGPVGLAFGPDGNLYVTSGFGTIVLRFSGTTGAFIDTFVSYASGGLNGSYDIAFGPDGGLYATSAGSGSVLHYDGKTGAFLGVFVASGTGGLSGPVGLTFGPDGNLYVVSGGNSVLRYNGTTGAFVDAFVPSVSQGSPFSLTFGPDGNLYVTTNNGPVGNGSSSGVLRYDGTTGAFLRTFATVTGSANFLAFAPPPPTGTATELIKNGGFETGDLTGWTTFNQLANGQTQSSGTFAVASGTAVPNNFSPQTVGPKSGTYYALGSESGPCASALSQTFTVPTGNAQKVTLSFDMFVDDYSQNGPVFGLQGLDYTGEANQQARVDLLKPGAAPLSTAAADVLKNFYDGVDSHGVPNPHGYTHYTFDITSLVGQGGTYTLRFAQVNNQFYLNQGVDNVNVQYVAAPTGPPPTVTLFVNPSTVAGGATSSLSIAFASPAPQTSPDPFSPGQMDQGAFVKLSSSSSAATFQQGPTGDGGYVFDGPNNTFYVHVNPGQTKTTLTLQTTPVSTSTAATLSGQYQEYTGTAILTILPPPATTTSLVSSLNPSAFGQPIVFTATVTSAGGTPTGIVTYFDGSTVLGTAAVNAQGQAGFLTGKLAPGAHSITASFAASASFVGSVSAPLTQTVSAPPAPVLGVSLSVGKAGRDSSGRVIVSVTITNKGTVPATVTFTKSTLAGKPAIASAPFTVAPSGSQIQIVMFAAAVASGKQPFTLALTATSSDPTAQPQSQNLSTGQNVLVP